MRILAIRGCNLASLAGEFEIDLANGPIGASGVFAIVGNTGAGKSTLLDALCVALFDRTPRLTNHSRVVVGRGDEDPHALGAQDVRTLLRRGASSGWAEVDFESGDARRYRARWSVRRARGQADGALQAQQVSLTSLDGSERLGGTKTETLDAIHERLGLTFDQFRRSALLAQGDFAAFLRADGKDRGELLERMTGTEIYTRLSVAAHANATLAAARLDKERSLADAIPVLPADERERAEQELRFASAAKSAARTRLAAVETAARWITEGAARADGVRAAQASHAAAGNALEQASALRDELALRRRVEALRGPWENAQRAERQLLTARGDSASATQATSGSLLRRDAVREQHAELADVLVPLRAARISAGLLERASLAMSGRTVHVDASRNHASDGTAHVGASRAHASDGTAHVGASQAHAALAIGRAALADAGWLSARPALTAEIAAWSDLDAKFAQHAAATDSANGLARSLAEHVERRDKLKQSRRVLAEELRAATEKQADAQRKAETFSKKRGLTLEAARRAEDTARVRKGDVEALVVLAASARSARGACSELDQHVAELAAAATADAEGRGAHESSRSTALTLRTERARVVAELRKAAGYEHARAELVEGDPCPLCGADEHPWRHRGALDDVIVAADNALDEAVAQLDAATTAIAHIDARSAQRKTERARLVKQRTAAGAAAAAAAPTWAESIGALGELLIVTDPATAEAEKLAADLLIAAGKALDAARATRSQTEAATKAASEAQAEVALCQANLDQLSARTSDLDRKLAEIEAAIGRLDGERSMRAERCEELVRELLDSAARWREAAVGIGVSPALSGDDRGLSYDDCRLSGNGRGLSGNDCGPSGNDRGLSAQRAWMSELATAWRSRAENVARAESAIAGAVAAALEDFQRAERAVVELSARAAEADKRVAELAATAVAAEHELLAARAAAAGAADHGSFTDEQLRTLLEGAAAAVDDIAAELATLERSAEVTRTILAERRRSMDAHAATRPESLDVLADLLEMSDPSGQARTIAVRLAELAEAARTADEHAATLTAALTADTDARARREQAQRQLAVAESAADVDRILGEAIGSHDGKRFRSFAQSLTLDGLLTVANAHLEELAPRYQLERVPRHDLELQVIDRDLGDEVRSVQSLSGGESFLVSLALALGLSSMSAHDVRVRTLLIDEGFGTLDPSTLEMALSVLEALRQQGRQVGVISHVPQLVERVGAHVKVIARGGGRSEVIVQ